MTVARRQGAFGALTGWWATAARALALVLALAVALPTAGLAQDIAFHQDHHGLDRTAFAASPEPGPGGRKAGDPGLDCHVHCGCHVALSPAGASSASPVTASRPRYARASATLPSVFPDRLPRPPRA